MATRRTPSRATVRRAVEALRRIAAHTTGLPDDSPADSQLRDRLELAADVLDATARAEEEGEKAPSQP
ncbi:MAG TPA: hypothetical protein DCQ30_10860 [Acidimicrobiaceae bacterium]|nr:hypothetical protein [Acidimicrobiaceae bacterium]